MYAISDRDKELLVRLLPVLPADSPDLRTYNLLRQCRRVLRRMQRRDDSMRTKYEDSLIDIVCRVSGLTRARLMSATRERPAPWCRYMIADWLVRHDGYTTTAAGDAVGLSHSTVVQRCRDMERTLSLPGFERELQIWREFQRIAEANYGGYGNAALDKDYDFDTKDGDGGED